MTARQLQIVECVRQNNKLTLTDAPPPFLAPPAAGRPEENFRLDFA
jgi:hypothetical protein